MASSRGSTINFNLGFIVKNNRLSRDVYLEKCIRQFSISNLILLISSTVGSQTLPVRGVFGASAFFYGATRPKKYLTLLFMK